MRALGSVPASVIVNNLLASDVWVAGVFKVPASASSVSIDLTKFTYKDKNTGIVLKQVVFQAIADLVNSGAFSFADATTLGGSDDLSSGAVAAEAKNLLRAGIPGFIPAGGGALPGITGATVGPASAYIDITFSDGVWRDAANSLPLTTAQLARTFAQNSGGGGTATAAAIASVTKVPSGALVGGETAIRVNLTITGTVHGEETVAIAPANGTSIYGSKQNSAAGLAMLASQTTGPKNLVP